MAKRTAKPPLSDAQLDALLSLLDEEDEEAREHVRGRLLEAAARSPRRLERALARAEEPARAEGTRLLQDVRWDRLHKRLEELAGRDDEAFDLEEGAVLLASFEYPGLKPAEVAGPLDEMAEDLRRVLSGTETPLETLQLVNDYLFELKGFRGNAENFHDPDNSYINRVLERRLGIPISLACLYLFLGRRLGIPFAGIGMPGHFIVQLRAGSKRLLLDPFDRGKVLTPSDCNEYLAKQGLDPDRKYLKAVSGRKILARMIANLVHVHSDRGDDRRTRRLTAFFRLFEEDA